MKGLPPRPGPIGTGAESPRAEPDPRREGARPLVGRRNRSYGAGSTRAAKRGAFPFPPCLTDDIAEGTKGPRPAPSHRTGVTSGKGSAGPFLIPHHPPTVALRPPGQALASVTRGGAVADDLSPRPCQGRDMSAPGRALAIAAVTAAARAALTRSPGMNASAIRLASARVLPRPQAIPGMPKT